MDSYAPFRHQASEDFSRARGRALLSRLQHILNVDRDRLLSFSDVKHILKPRTETYQGMQVVELEHIVGSEGRYHDFNKYFLPRSEHLRNRWERVDLAHLTDTILPPIQLYEIGGVYFVRDGNHRVSVARSQGGHAIDAEVTSLSSEVRIHPAMTVDDLRREVINMEKRLFYDKTNFLELTSYKDLTFSTTGRYDVIYHHILEHKYYINQDRDEEISFDEALISWFNLVYLPIVRVIEDEKLTYRFMGRTSSDLYVWIVKHWDFLKRKYGLSVSPDYAVKDFSTKYGKGFWTYVLEWFGKTKTRLRKQ